MIADLPSVPLDHRRSLGAMARYTIPRDDTTISTVHGRVFGTLLGLLDTTVIDINRASVPRLLQPRNDLQCCRRRQSIRSDLLWNILERNVESMVIRSNQQRDDPIVVWTVSDGKL